MATLSDIETSVRAATFKITTGRTPQSVIWLFVNEEYQALRRRLADAVPDLYTKVTADFTVAASTYSVDLSASPISLTDFGKVRVVERKESGQYYPLEVAAAMAPGDLDSCIAGTYRVRYVTKPAKLTAGTDVLEIPDGAERVLVESIAARLRVREQEDPSPHIRWREQAWTEIRDSLVQQYVSTPQEVEVVAPSIGLAFRFRGPATIDLFATRSW